MVVALEFHVQPQACFDHHDSSAPFNFKIEQTFAERQTIQQFYHKTKSTG